MQHLLVIGVGNEHRGDDAAGIRVAQALQGCSRGNVAAVTLSGEGTALMEAWAGAGRLDLVDAVRSGAEAGTVHRLDASAAPLPSDFFHYSTHAFGLAEAVEMARVLGRLPPVLIVYGIEGASFAAGAPLSTPVARAVAEVAARIADELGACAGRAA